MLYFGLVDVLCSHIEVRIKAAMINAVYHKSLAVDLYGCKESTGKINNLMSIDVEVCKLDYLLL